MMIPLLYAPLLPLIRLGARPGAAHAASAHLSGPHRAGLRRNPPLRDKAFAAAVGAALLHAGYIMGSDSSV